MGGISTGGRGLGEVGGALTNFCRILSVLLNFLEPGCSMDSLNSTLVMVKFRVKGIRKGVSPACREKKRRPQFRAVVTVVGPH